MNTLADQYYIKALDQYPYSLEEAIENLSYALSHNNEHVGANYLMGKLHQEHMNDFQKAESYYLKALAADGEALSVCMDYISLLIVLKEYDKAQNLINYSNKLRGVDLARTLASKALIQEYQHHYDEALELYKQAKLEVYNEEAINHLNNDIKRVKMKRKQVKKTDDKKKREAQLGFP